jgi:hypothetical protein
MKGCTFAEKFKEVKKHIFTKCIAICAILTGAILIYTGCKSTIPGVTVLSAHQYLANGQIVDYSNNPAILGGRISGATIAKSIYINSGILIIILGFLTLAYCFDTNKGTTRDQIDSDKEINYNSNENC